MNDKKFYFETEQLQRADHEFLVVRPRGEFIANDAKGFVASVLELVGEKTRAVLMVMKEVEYIDSMGLGMLLELMREVTLARKRKMVLVDLHAQVRMILEMGNLAGVFETRDNLDEAVEQLERNGLKG